MLVHEVMSTGLVTVKKTDTIRSAVMKMMHRHCGSLPVAPFLWSRQTISSLEW